MWQTMIESPKRIVHDSPLGSINSDSLKAKSAQTRYFEFTYYLGDIKTQRPFVQQRAVEFINK